MQKPTNPKKEKVTLKQAFKSNHYMIRLSYKASPKRVIWAFLVRVFTSVRKIFFRIIFWEGVLGLIERGASFEDAVLFLIFAVIVVAVTNVGGVYFDNVVESVENQRLYEYLHRQMFAKATDVELECFENPQFYNKYMKAVTQIKGRSHTVLWVTSRLAASVVTMVYLLYKTIRIDPFAIVFAVFPMITTYIFEKKINQLKYDLYQMNIFEERKKEYVKRSVYQQDFAKELRLSNGFTLLMSYFHEAIDTIIKNTQKFGFKIGLFSCFSESISQVLVTAGSILYASVRLLYFKNLQVSEYIVLINAIVTLSELLTDAVYCISRIQENHLYIQNIREFMEYEPKISESQEGLPVDREELLLKMEDVSFTYFGQDKEVLKDINISISKKEKIVLVGENGAGKSTLVKLLMRLYDPTEGRITLNGHDVKEYAVREYRNLFGTVFQDFRIFGLTVAENVLMHRMREEEAAQVETALKNSGVYDKVQTLPNGIQTTLTREFDSDGAVLSGGESQKIAIARVFAKDCEIAVLDEPSSALDPIAEYKMYESMLKACEDKAVVFISHRLSSAVLADKIYMLEHGRVVETGTHEELMEKNGKYAEMFRFQASSYVGGEEAS